MHIDQPIAGIICRKNGFLAADYLTLGIPDDECNLALVFRGVKYPLTGTPSVTHLCFIGQGERSRHLETP